MSKFTKTIVYQTTFEGDNVTVKMNRLKRAAMLKLSPHLPEPGEQIPADFIDAAAGILPEHVVEVVGLTDSEGGELGINEIVEEAYFLRLLGEIVEQLFVQSNLSEDDEGNFDEQPNTSTGEPGTSGASA